MGHIPKEIAPLERITEPTGKLITVEKVGGSGISELVLSQWLGTGRIQRNDPLQPIVVVDPFEDVRFVRTFLQLGQNFGQPTMEQRLGGDVADQIFGKVGQTVVCPFTDVGQMHTERIKCLSIKDRKRSQERQMKT